MTSRPSRVTYCASSAARNSKKPFWVSGSTDMGPDSPDVVAAESRAHGRLDFVTPEAPESIPLFWNVLEGEPRVLEQTFPDMDVVARTAHRQPVQGPLSGFCVQPQFPA